MPRLLLYCLISGFAFGLGLGCDTSKGPSVASGSGPETKSGEPATLDDKPESGVVSGVPEMVYRTPKELLADMPKESFPKAGSEDGLSRADARKWLGKNLVLRAVESTATVKSVSVQGDDPFLVTVETDHPTAGGKVEVPQALYTSVLFGEAVSLGGQDCRVIIQSWHSAGTLFSYAGCTRDEVRRIQAMKGKTVAFRCQIQEATLQDNFGIGSSLPIVITTTSPSLDRFLPQYLAGGGSGFPGGAFRKDGAGDLTLRLDPGKATVFRGQLAEVTFRTTPTSDTVTFSRVPNNKDEAVRPWLSSWQFKDKRLMLSIRVDSTKEATLLNGTWLLKE